MSIPAINQVLEQMSSLQGVNPFAAASPASHTGSASFNNVEFSSFLTHALTKVSDVQNSSRMQAEAFERGEPGIDLTSVMIDLQKASVGMQLAVQVRNRMVQAYQEIMNMPV